MTYVSSETGHVRPDSLGYPQTFRGVLRGKLRFPNRKHRQHKPPLSRFMRHYNRDKRRMQEKVFGLMNRSG
jgi:hypothetical protein